MNKIDITQSTIEYVFQGVPDPEGWSLAYCISKDNQGNYRIGLLDRVISENEVRERLSDNQIAELEKKLQIGEGNALWLTEKGEYYIANKYNPISDQSKRWVGRQPN